MDAQLVRCFDVFEMAGIPLKEVAEYVGVSPQCVGRARKVGRCQLAVKRKIFRLAREAAEELNERERTFAALESLREQQR